MSNNEKNVTIKRVGASMKDEYIDLLEKGFKPDEIKKYTDEMTKKKPEQVKDIKPTRPLTNSPSMKTTIGAEEEDVAYLKGNDFGSQKLATDNNCPIKDGKNPEASEDIEYLKNNNFSKNAASKKAAQMDSFVQQYLETALWSSTDDNEEPLDKNYSISDVAEEAVQKAIEDCNAFREAAGEIISEYDETQVAHDFWLTRNRHGAGFWDGDYEESDGENLTKIAHEFGEVDPYVGDDGKIYIG